MRQDRDICFMTATEMATAIRAGHLSAYEVVVAHLARIESVNPQVNAIVTLHGEQALESARAADETQVRGATLGPLHGYGIARRIEQVSGDLLEVNQGTIYPALLKLEQMGWIRAKWGVSDNNRSAKYYSLTATGR